MGRLVVEQRRARVPGASEPPPRASSHIDRRSLLVGGAATALLAGCGATAAPTARGGAAPAAAALRVPSEPVLVVGGGTAGLLCAYRLMQAGVPALVLEANSRVGGRMFSDSQTFGPEQVCELGGEFVDTPHHTLHKLAKELGLTLDDCKAPAAGLEASYHFGGRAYTEAEMVHALRPAAALMARDLEQAGLDEEVPYRSGPAAKRLDALSIDDYLTTRAITGVAAALLKVAFGTELGLDSSELGAVMMLWMFTLEADKLELFGESDERFRFRGGNGQVPQRLAAALGERVRLGCRLSGLRKGAEGRFVLTIHHGAGTEELTSERVVLALPFTLLRGVSIDASVTLSARKRQAIAELGYGSNAKLMLGFSTRYWEDRRKSGEIFTDTALQSSWDTSRPQPGREGILTVYTGGELGVRVGAGSAEAQRDAHLALLEAPLPGAQGASNGKVARFHWPSAPFARGSYSTYKPGQLTSFGGAEREIEADGLHFAGEHTSVHWQGFMEGAAESGERAAQEIVQALQKPKT